MAIQVGQMRISKRALYDEFELPKFQQFEFELPKFQQFDFELPEFRQFNLKSGLPKFRQFRMVR